MEPIHVATNASAPSPSREFKATFGVFKIQRPQGASVECVIVDIYSTLREIPSVSVLANLVAALAMRNVKDSGGQIISQNGYLGWEILALE
jgi:hypothetical protein